MATVSENLGFVAGIYQLENTDPVEGGVNGIANRQAKELASRTKWLKDQLEAMAWRTGDIKEVDCTNAYIAANFDSTGLGINERVGWAICNGQNGTRDRSERVGVGYGGSFTNMGATGGSKNAVLVSHSHTIAPDLKYNGPGGGNVGLDLASDVFVSSASQTTSTVGESGTGKNMQPYIVTLYIQKL